jgi:predicted phage terminase large subunit-like protein
MSELDNIPVLDFSKLPKAVVDSEEHKTAHRMYLIASSRDSMQDYCHLMMPDVEDPDDTRKTEYQRAGHSKMLCDIVERFEAGKSKRVAVSIPPQHGKTIHLSQLGLSWIWGKNPRKNILVVTYNQTRADELGHEFRQMIRDKPTFRQVFPEVEFQADAKSKSFMQNKAGGKIFFIGVGGTITGRTADYIIIDDPFKGDDDEFTEGHLEKIWSWFYKVAYSRASNRTKICVIHCMVGETPVLMADGQEKRLDQVRPGDDVASYKNGRIVASKVLNWKNQGRDCLFTIRMKSGISVRANARHPFLVCENGEEKWLRTDQIKKGMFIRKVIGENGEINNAQLKDVTNLQGVKDCATHTTVKNDGQMDTDPRHTTQKAEEDHICDTDMGLNPKIIKECLKSKKGSVQSVNNSLKKLKTTKQDGTESCSLTTATTQKKSEDCSATTATCLSNREIQSQFYGQPLSTLKITDDEVDEIVFEGEEDVFDIEVENTENFIANGLVSHNTRWNEDDLIGRLCDPTHPDRNKRFKGISDDWEFMNIPGVIKDDRLAKALDLKLSVPKNKKVIEQFGEDASTALWPKEKSLEFFAQWKRGDPRSFSALVMGSPTPDDGIYFTKEMIVPYQRDELPSNLRIYSASDHAVTEKQQRDKTVVGAVGIDEEDNIWILPDLVWDNMETDRTVEELLAMFRRNEPSCHWMESELISKSFGPFLRKRMIEERIYTLIDPVTPTRDKMSRARSIQGRMSMQKVFFPAFAPWFNDAKNQLMRFPHGANDDFVDWIAWIGLGLTKEIAASSYRPPKNNVPKTGTAGWVVYDSEQRQRQQNLQKNSKGW